jgi:CDP-diacylglycerol--glycerol-3-phosphate 3-phosphatidyltransferase
MRRAASGRIDGDAAGNQGAGMTVQADGTLRRRVHLGASNLPNILTYGRIAAAPLVGATYYAPGDWGPWIAFAIFAIASITDYFDGYLARAWQQQSALGRMLDPIADKLLVSVSILILVADGVLDGWSIWAAIIVLMREIFVSGLREFLAELRVSVPVTRLAKWKTTMQLLAIGLLLVAPAIDGVRDKEGPVVYLGLTFFWATAIVTLYTGYDYFRAGLKHIVDEGR